MKKELDDESLETLASITAWKNSFQNVDFEGLVESIKELLVDEIDLDGIMVKKFMNYIRKF